MKVPSAPNRPILGLTTEVLAPPLYEGNRRYQLFTDYAASVRESGAFPLLFPGDTPPEDASFLLDQVDGLLLTGGDDLDLSLLGGDSPVAECKVVAAEQQILNFALLEEALKRNMPVFGICLGMQVIGIADGAELEQHMVLHNDHKSGIEHLVQPASQSLLATIVGTESFSIRSYHHQAIFPDKLNGWVPSAVAKDGTLEAIECSQYDFALGVQWHPEKTPDSPSSKALFQAFTEAAKRFSQKVSA